LRIYNRAMGKKVRTLSPEAMEALQSRDWPGNVRELQSAVKYALIRATGEVIEAEALPEPSRAVVDAAGADERDDNPCLEVFRFVSEKLRAGETDILEKTYAAVDRIVLDAVLRRARGNQVYASQLLGVSRNTLRAKLRNLGMAIEKQLR